MILISEPPAIVERAITLDKQQLKTLAKIENDWGPLCRAIGGGYGIPDGWLQAMIFRESEGDPQARNKEGTPTDPHDDGLGLLQITHPSLKGRRRAVIDGRTIWVGGLTDTEVMEPSTNIAIGAKYIREKMVTYGLDFPRMAAAFNSGSAHPASDPAHDNPWALHSTGNHISIEVAALNSWHLEIRIGGNYIADPNQVQLISLIDIAREADDQARRDTEPPNDAA